MKTVLYWICFQMLSSAIDGSEFLKRLPRINNNFGLRLFRKVTGNDRNVFISPYGVLSSLGMVYKGSDDVTYDDLTSGLQLGVAGNDLVGAALHIAVKELERLLVESELDYDLFKANKIYLQSGYGVLKNYRRGLSYYYGSGAEEIDFQTDDGAASSSRKINGWVADRTKNKIRSSIDPLVDPNVVMMIVTAAYFKGSWENEFPISGSSESTFTRDKDTVVKVQTMRRIVQTNFVHSDHLDAKVVRLPYAGDGISMVVVLPEQLDGVGKIERELSDDLLSGVFKNLTDSKKLNVEVKLPKFKLAETYNLVDDISALGMESLFTDKADFSLINGKKNLKVTNFVHSTYVEVSEKGSEAATFNGFQLTASSRQHKPEVTFDADHPFLFFITVKKPDLPEMILFVGKILKPQQ